ncbi:glycosyltransferase family 4 protein [Desulfoscipio gibsoniae]|uniref:Glycosyltransferase n=1 Tax=Desulfoscipio gibsoniae DSM 7213 TaxID=767817 RepID=R4KL80_9FIRM|nr:glycosyltransferase family 4 protein [Desulfoscipio gibsoniae]AGL03953.1 glycosyltransferase [Desulfoscipio gibsoniae DSM 7213]
MGSAVKKSIWIFNHYAGTPSVTTGLRHYNFAKYLIKAGYPTTVFASSAIHNSNNNLIKGKETYITDDSEEVPFVYVKTRNYQDNGKSRILNMIDYYRGLFKVTKYFEKPDLLIASSVHPLTLVAGLKIAKKLDVKCICEIRDLWPESFVAYGIVKKSNPILKLLYAGEKWIYKKADKLIFTMEGGKDYIIEHGWDKEHGGPIDINKVYHVNNGVDLEQFNYNKEHYALDDKNLNDETTFKVIYTGSVRRVNNLNSILEAAKLIKNPKIKIFIWGDGDERLPLQQQCRDNGIDNVIFKGRVDKKYIPYILCHADVNLLHNDYTPITRYGMSQNKLFDYMAANKPIVSDLITNHDLILRYKLGVVTENQSPQKIKEAIEKFYYMTAEERLALNDNLHRAACDYDFKNLTNQLINIIEI